MSFLTPLLLFGTLAVAIPIILHLINFRKPNKQQFSTLVFFQQLQRSSIKWLKLKKRILLAIRIAAICFLAFALARPFFAPDYSFFIPDRGSVLYALLIENSPAMTQVDERGPLMQTAVGVAEKLIENAGEEDRFLLFNTHGALLYPDELSRDRAMRIISSIESVNASNNFETRLRDLISRAQGTDRDATALYVIGRGSIQLEDILTNFETGSSFNASLLPLTVITTGESPSTNTAISNISSPNQIVAGGRPVSILVDVANFGTQPAFNQFLSLEIENEIKGQYQIDLNPGEQQTFTFDIVAPERGYLNARAVLEGNSYTFDNVRYFSIEIPERTRIALVRSADNRNARSWLNPVFMAASRSTGQLSVDNITWDDISRIQSEGYDAVILDGVSSIPEFAWPELQNFTQSGGGLVLVPGEDGNPERINPFLQRMNAGRFTGFTGVPGRFEEVARVDRIVRGHPVLDEIFDVQEDEDVRIDLPRIYHYWNYSPGSSSAAQVILRTNLDDPLLIDHRVGNGRFVIAATSPDPAWSGFAINPIFAPLFYRVGMYAAAGESGSVNEFELGKPFEWSLNRDFDTFTLSLNDVELVPEIRSVGGGLLLNAPTDEWTPGFAKLANQTDTLYIAVNQRSEESDFNILESRRIRELFSEHFSVNDVLSLGDRTADEASASIGAASTGREIWNWFIIVAILLLAGESFVAKKLRGDTTV